MTLKEIQQKFQVQYPQYSKVIHKAYDTNYKRDKPRTLYLINRNQLIDFYISIVGVNIPGTKSTYYPEFVVGVKGITVPLGILGKEKIPGITYAIHTPRLELLHLYNGAWDNPFCYKEIQTSWYFTKPQYYTNISEWFKFITNYGLNFYTEVNTIEKLIKFLESKKTIRDNAYTYEFMLYLVYRLNKEEDKAKTFKSMFKNQEKFQELDALNIL